MNCWWRLSRTILVCSLLSPFPTYAAERTFAHSDRIRYDGHCLTIDGRDTFIYCGAFHYFRCPKPLWPARFAAIKAAGFNTVETYIPWNHSETSAPANLDDFSKIDLRDADDFMTMAESYGLNVIIRPGPYICAEWDRGGFPSWLLAMRPAELPKTTPWFRTDNAAFMAWSRHWFDAVCPVVAKHQITHKAMGRPGVILFQIENEYDYSKFPDRMRTTYLADLSNEAVAKGIDVPLFTCWTSCVRGTSDPSVARAFDSCNFYVSYGVDGTATDLKKAHDQQPDAPIMVTEQQGGWFTAPTEAQPLRPDVDFYRSDLGPSQIQNLELYSIQNGATLTNFYMLFGGTNLGFGDPGLQIATCYDYTAAIRECGGVGEKYNRVKGIGEFLAEHGAKLARAEAVACDVKADQKDVAVGERVDPDGGRYFFVRTSQHDQPRKGVAEVTSFGQTLSINYDLEPFGSKVLYLPRGERDVSHGQWSPRAAAPLIRPDAADLPSSVEIHQVAGRIDVPYKESFAVKGKGLAMLGIGDRQLIYYHATASLPAMIKNLYLVAEVAPTDNVGGLVNGKPLGMMDKGRLDISSALHGGDNEIELVYDDAGYANFDADIAPAEKMERLGGITGLHLVRATGAARGGEVVGWRMRLLDPATAFVAVPAGMEPDALNPLPELRPDFNDADWERAPNTKGRAEQLLAHQTAAFRATIDVAAGDLSAGRTVLNIARMDDGGWAYVNGQLVGRGTNWDDSYAFDSTKALKAGKNSIVIVIRNENGVGGVGAVKLTAPEQIIADLGSTLRYTVRSAGTQGNWMNELSADGWTQRPIPESPTSSDTAVEWRRLSFELPDAKPGVWVPWLLRLYANGDGIMSLNGHPIGRYYHATPQTDYYLPECWLNSGNGHPNLVTLQLHRADAPIGIKSAEVMPYTAYAEKR